MIHSVKKEDKALSRVFFIASVIFNCSFIRKPIGDISLDGLGQDWTLRRYILHLNDI